MKDFIYDIIKFVSIVVLSIFAIIFADFFFVGNQYEQSFQASLIDKVNRLESLNVPKIILVGNSNVAFGFRSELIEEEFNMPVVNLGLHGGLGNKFHENIAKLNINEGDIVVLCHTSYGNFNKIGDAELAVTTLEWNRELWKILEISDYGEIIGAIPNYILNSFVLKITGRGNVPGTDCYSRNAFNSYGDNVFVDTNDQFVRYVFKSGELDEYIPGVGDISVDRVNRLNEYVKSRGATLLIGGFPIADGKYTPDHKLYSEFERKLRDSVNCPVIFKCDDYYFDYDYFYDTVFHLTKEGAEIRTQMFIKDLRKYLGKDDDK